MLTRRAIKLASYAVIPRPILIPRSRQDPWRRYWSRSLSALPRQDGNAGQRKPQIACEPADRQVGVHQFDLHPSVRCVGLRLGKLAKMD